MSKPKNLETKVDIVEDVLKAIQELARRHVLVGVPDENADRYKTLSAARKAKKTGDSSAGIESLPNAAIGYILETGDPAHNLPARPFLVPTILKIRGDLAKRARTTLTRVTSGKPGAQQEVSRGLGGIGLLAANAVKTTINTGDFAPLAASTIYRRQNRKKAPRSGEKPLIDTGQLRNSITYVIRGK